MDRDTILENFLACTGITDITYGISVLEEHDWDLTAAASSIIGQGISGASFVQEDQSFPCSAVYSVAPPLGPLLNPESSVNYVSGTQNVSVSTMCGFETDFSGNNMSPTVSRSVVERDNDQTNLFGPVRILNFEIELELPLEESDNEPKVITESFPFPDTETVTFLKRHFIDCRLAELIQLATSPDLESKITEYTKTNLLKHLVLESSGSHSFADNSAVLRSLHLPKCVKLRAKLSPNPLPDSSSLANQQDESVKLHISLYEKPKTKVDHGNNDTDDDTNRPDRSRIRARSRSPYGHHCMRLPLNSRISQIRNDLFRISGIPVPSQIWSVKPQNNLLVNEQIPSNAVLDSLVIHLNHRFNQQQKHRSTSSKLQDSSTTVIDVAPVQTSIRDNPTLADLGLKSGDVCELCLTASHPFNNAKNASKTLSFQNDPIQFKPLSSTQQQQQTSLSQQPLDNILMPSSSNLGVFRNEASNMNKSSRKITTSKKQIDDNISPEVGSDYDDDYDMDYHYSSDEMLDPTEDNKVTPWNMPLIPDSPSSEDPEMATQQFCIVFLQRYCSDGVTMAPPFSTCSLDNALSLSVGTSQVSDRKPLFIYLHNDNSVACHVFCQQVLCSPGLLRFLTDHEFSLWPWDVTRARGKERLLGWLEVKLPNLSRIITPLSVDSYPILAMIVKLSGQLEVLCIVMGTGKVKMWPLDPFPPLGVHTTNPLTIQSDDSLATGSLKADVIVAELWQAYTNYLEVLEPERAAERELIARRRVLEEQEAAYEESLRRDQQKEWERAKAKAEEDRQKKLEEEKRIHDELKATQHRLSMAASLPPEPPVPKTPAAEAFLSSPKGIAGITTLRFRLPQGVTDLVDNNDSTIKNATVIRRFSGVDILKHVFSFLESKGFSISDYKLLTTYPTRDLTLMDENMTLADLKLVPQETLTLELR